MTAAANWSYPTAVRFGADRIAELPKCCAAAGMKRPLLVTDRGLAGLPVTARTQEILEAAGLGRAMFSEVATNPDDASLAAGVAAFRDGGCDGVVAFGGGSALDLGKAVALMQGHEGSVFDYAAPRPLFQSPWQLDSSYDPTPDNSRGPNGFFFLDREPATEVPISLVLGWQALLDGED